MTKRVPTPYQLPTLTLAEIRRAARAGRVATAVLLQMNLRGRGGRRP